MGEDIDKGGGDHEIYVNTREVFLCFLELLFGLGSIMLISLFLCFTSLVSVTGSYTVDDCLYPKSLRQPQAINNDRSQLRNNTFFPVRFFRVNTLKGTTTSFLC